MHSLSYEPIIACAAAPEYPPNAAHRGCAEWRGGCLLAWLDTANCSAAQLESLDVEHEHGYQSATPRDVAMFFAQAKSASARLRLRTTFTIRFARYLLRRTQREQSNEP